MPQYPKRSKGAKILDEMAAVWTIAETIEMTHDRGQHPENYPPGNWGYEYWRQWTPWKLGRWRSERQGA